MCIFALVPSGAEAEPLAEFKVRLERAKTVVSPPQVKMSGAKPKKGAQSEWLRTQPTLKDLRYDVRRTDSLVSPFVAWAELTVGNRVETYPTEAQARAASGVVKGNDSSLDYFFRLDFAYQDNKWVLASGWCSLVLLMDTERMLRGSEKRYAIDPASGGCMSDKEVGIFVKPLLQ